MGFGIGQLRDTFSMGAVLGGLLMSGRGKQEELGSQVDWPEKSQHCKDLHFEKASELLPVGLRFLSRFLSISPLSTRLVENPQMGTQDLH